MSLDQLPDDLIANIGKFLNYEDNIQLGMSQKKMHRILKRDGLDKPEVNTVVNDHDEFIYTIYRTVDDYLISFFDDEITYRTFHCEELVDDPKYATCTGKLLSRFRSVDTYAIEDPCSDESYNDLLTTRTKISNILFIHGELVRDDYNPIIAICRKFKTTIRLTEMVRNFYTDETSIELNIVRELRQKSDHPLTDNILDFISAHLDKITVFVISAAENAFTTMRIRELVQKLVHEKRWNVTYDFGILKADQAVYAEHWLEEVANNGTYEMKASNEETRISYEIRFNFYNHCSITFSYLK